MKEPIYKNLIYKLIKTIDNEREIDICFACEDMEFVIWHLKKEKIWLFDRAKAEKNPENPIFKWKKRDVTENYKEENKEFARFLFNESNLRIRLMMIFGPNFFDTIK